MMLSRNQVYMLVISLQFRFLILHTNAQDAASLKAIKGGWANTPPSWKNADPCKSWEGIECTDGCVTSITLASANISGELSGDMWQLTELVILDLSYNKGLTGTISPLINNLKKLTSLVLVGCNFYGSIPDTIGSMENLIKLSLNSNGFTGEIPSSLGNLLNLDWLDLADNKLSGAIPVSSGTTPGLDMMIRAKHFHFGKNRLSGSIPAKLFHPNMILKHVLFDNNQLSDSIPATVGLLPQLEVLRLDRNSLSGPVPHLGELANLNELYLSDNQLTGSVPDLTGMDSLTGVELSNNNFNVSSFPPSVLTLNSLTTLVMDNIGLEGDIPISLFSLPDLQTISLKSNKLNGTSNGTLDLGGTVSSQLERIDLQYNTIDSYVNRGTLGLHLILIGNPICRLPGSSNTYCTLPKSNPPYTTLPNNCNPKSCFLDQVSSPKCKCAHPYTGTLTFRAPSFSDFENLTLYSILEQSLIDDFKSEFLVDSVSLSNPTIDINNYFVLDMAIFPAGQVSFDRTRVSSIGFHLSNQMYKPPQEFGPYVFIADPYGPFVDSMGPEKLHTGIIIGAIVGGSVLFLLALFAGICALQQKKRAEKADKINNPFASWDPNESIGDVPQLKGVRSFTFSEVKKYTNNFSETQNIGSGGYGRVYRGTLPNGQVVAIKRAQPGSMQGGLEFKTEIELLSRVHHKNVVSLVGFCFEQDEQMLVYEYISNGTLNDSISGKSGIRLDWMRRLRIALGGARGLQYLHELANPTIIHRDIKSNNILLDEKLNAKVADFGLSKLAGDIEMGPITTQVKGTVGYLDPEYYMSNQLTEKSDVYSFGVLLLELITGRQPIEKGKFIVREVRQRMDRMKPLYNLEDIIDPTVLGSSPTGLEKFVDMALRCVEEAGANRPTSGEVVKEIEDILKMAGMNPDATTSENFEGVGKGNSHPYKDESLFAYSGSFPESKELPESRLIGRGDPS